MDRIRGCDPIGCPPVKVSPLMATSKAKPRTAKPGVPKWNDAATLRPSRGPKPVVVVSLDKARECLRIRYP